MSAFRKNVLETGGEKGVEFAGVPDLPLQFLVLPDSGRKRGLIQRQVRGAEDGPPVPPRTQAGIEKRRRACQMRREQFGMHAREIDASDRQIRMLA
jgi:hypothetical protein